MGAMTVDAITAADVAGLVAELHAAGRARGSIRKTVDALAMALDHAGVSPNPARDRVRVRLPHEDRHEPQPPTAGHVEAVCRVLPARYRLPLLVLDATGMRVGELDALTWGDVDEQRGRWRVSRAVSKTGAGRWVSVPPALFEAVCELLPREDRVPDRRVFAGFGGDRFRTSRRARAWPPACRRSHRTISATGGSASSTCAACRRPASASSSASATSA